MENKNKIIEYINEYIDILLEDDYSAIISSLRDIDNSLKMYRDSKLTDLGIQPKNRTYRSNEKGDTYKDDIDKEELDYNFCVITFMDDYSLDLPKYGTAEYFRNLNGTMYFYIKHIDLNNKILHLKTKSMSEEFFLVIEDFYDLKTDIKQEGYAYLAYDNKLNREIYKGSEKKIEFIFNDFKKIDK